MVEEEITGLELKYQMKEEELKNPTGTELLESTGEETPIPLEPLTESSIPTVSGQDVNNFSSFTDVIRSENDLQKKISTSLDLDTSSTLDSYKKTLRVKQKGRFFRKITEVHDSDIESISSCGDFILPRVIQNPLLIRELFKGVQDNIVDETTNRMVKHIVETNAKPTDEVVFKQDRKCTDVQTVKTIKDLAITPGLHLLTKALGEWMEKKIKPDAFNELFNLKKENGKVKSMSANITATTEQDIDSEEKYSEMLSQYVLISMCRKYDEEYWDLVLHGKEVEMYIGRRISDDDIIMIFEFVKYNKEIRYVDLSYNQITSFGLALIAICVSQNPNIIGLNVMNNEITHISKLTRKRLGEKSNIQQLRLNGNPLNKLGRISAACLLRYNKLVLLDLGETCQNVRTACWLSSFARTCTSIEVLDISRILGQRGYNLRSYYLAYIFCDILKFNRSLVELHLQKNNLGDSDVQELVVGLVQHPKLKVIDLSCNDICDFGCEIIAKILPETKALTSLILSNNKIRNSGARALAAKLPFSKISVLNIARNAISDEGMIDLLRIINKPHPFEALFIYGNPFGTLTVEMLYKSLNNYYLCPNCVDTHVILEGGMLSVIHNPLADRYRSRYYRQYESWRPGVWRWDGQSPIYYGVKESVKTCYFPQTRPLEIKSLFPNTCGI